MKFEAFRKLIDSIMKLEAREWRDSSGRVIVGALWLRRDEVVQLLEKQITGEPTSKNLQEERDQAERKYQTLLQQRYENMEGFRFRGLTYQELTQKLAKFAELESEITALRKVG